MAGETTCVYNTVPLGLIDTAEIASRAVNDPLANKDLMYVENTIRMESIVAPGIVPALPGESPAQTMVRVAHLLAQPRRPFVYAVNGIPLFQSDGLDPAGGPMPVPPKITQIAAGGFRIEFQIVVCTNECPERNFPAPVWLSLRWTQDQVIDEANYSTIVMTGRLVAAANMLKKLKSIDDLRGVVVPPVPPNFIRHSKYTISADGLTLDFIHTDQEQFIMPPADAVKLKGTARHYFVKGGGKWYAEVNVALEGRKDAPKWRLMATCLSIAFNRLKKAQPLGQQKQKLMILEGSMEESFEKNGVQVKLLAITAAPNMAANANAGGLAYAMGAGAGDLVIVGGLQQVPVVGPILATGYLASQVAAAIQQAREQAKAQAAALQAPPLGIVPGDLNQWGSPLLGCGMPTDPPQAGIGPDLWGNLPQFRLIAAAFRDPCLDNTVAIAQASKLQSQGEQLQKGDFPRPATLGVGPVRSPVTPTYPGQSSVLVLNGMPPALPVTLKSAYDQYPGVFEEYTIESEYVYKPNTAVLPRTISGQPGVQVSWANPELSLRSTWSVSKNGGPPTIPSPATRDANTVLVGSAMVPQNVELGADGLTLCYTISGCFDYQFLDPSKVNVTAPLVPWLNLDANYLPAFPTSPNAIFAAPTTSTLTSQQK